MAARGEFSREDMIQLAQLGGYSVGGAADLSYMDEETIEEADRETLDLLANNRDKPV